MGSWLTQAGRLGIAAALVALASGTALAGTELTVYTALEADQLEEYKAAFEADNPDITINWVRDSTGIVTAKLLAEKANPQADIVWGLAATSLLLLDKEGMLEPYAPAGLDKINPRFRDSANPPAWVGMDVWMAAICFNTVEAEKKGLPKPASWKDLLDPAYQGSIVMPNPNSSGTGFLDVSSWLQLMGEDGGWSFMDGLHANIGVYTHSGSKPCKMAAAGEYPIGISFEYRAAKLKTDGAPIDIVFPAEGIGWDMEATGIVKGTDALDAAKTLADWAASEKANAMYAKYYGVVAIPGIAQPIPNYPENPEGIMIDNDFAWAAGNREAILAEWTKRYDSKSEPKS
jgi:iron(III) transport system substrate-binding protein